MLMCIYKCAVTIYDDLKQLINVLRGEKIWSIFNAILHEIIYAVVWNIKLHKWSSHINTTFFENKYQSIDFLYLPLVLDSVHQGSTSTSIFTSSTPSSFMLTVSSGSASISNVYNVRRCLVNRSNWISFK